MQSAPSLHCGMQSAPSLPSLPSLLWPGVIAPDRNITFFNIESVYLCQTDLFEIELLICIKMNLVLRTYNGWYVKKQTKPNQTKQTFSFWGFDDVR